jgi:transcriptional regulator with XRE-family HTH domain
MPYRHENSGRAATYPSFCYEDEAWIGEGTLPARPARIVFSEVLDTLMTKAGLENKALAAAVGVDESYISRLRDGKRNPSFDILDKIANFFDTTPARLIEDPGEAPEARSIREAAQLAALRDAHRKLGEAIDAVLKPEEPLSRD